MSHCHRLWGPSSLVSPLLLFAFAAFRLRTRTIWPLMILHGLSDVYVNITLFATPQHNVGTTTGPSAFIALILSFGLLILLYGTLALYGFFLLRRQEREEKLVGSAG